MTATKADLEAALAESDAKIAELEEELKNAPKWDDAGKPTVYEAWNRVMRDVQFISKNSRNEQQKFNFRGIDAVMNAVGPVLREHGVIVVPTGAEHEAERYLSKNGGQMCNRTAEMSYRVYGPAGDHFDGVAVGEAADSGDKSMTKAESVALRTFLLQSLMLPTDDPDPDASSHERAVPVRTQAQAQPMPAPDDNPESREARGALRAKAQEHGWNLGAIADKFAKDNKGKALKDATAAEVEAYTNLLATGAVTV
ncbi:ERF family ssDNA binding protein [Mycobacterium phage Bromden]|uniref:ERF family ssDNA binding protein n=1 Tax=Mycobacterium phage Bromden TaxID=2283252 RepID=A0A345MBJ8_9CAUD|nr:ERF family ssDNA binding protein [Mycobacterium phage Bromden]AXH67869.1 ERF family ssDNA binding protein [Mycobacterium phage Bromden]